MYGASLGISNVHVQQHRTTKFHPNRINTAELWRHIDFSRWRPRRGNSTSDFVFGDFAQLARSKKTRNIYLPTKFRRDISQSTAEILLLPVFETNGRHVGILIPVSIFTFASPSVGHSASAVQFSSKLKLDYPRHNYDVISIFQNGGHGIAILLPVSFYVTSLILEGRNQPREQISWDISIHRWDITTSGFWNKRPPRWNSTSGFDLHVHITIGVSFCVCLPNFVLIGTPTT